MLGPGQGLRRTGEFRLPAAQSVQFLLCRRLLAPQPLDRPLRAGNQGLGVPRVAQELALPLQISAGTRHLPGQAEASRQFLGLERRLAGLALDPGEFLLDHPLRGLALRQTLDLLAPRSDLCRAQRQDPLGQGQMELSTLHGLGTSQHREAFPALVLQTLPAVALLGDALGDALRQPFQPLRLALVLGLQGVDGLRSGLDHGLAFALKLLPARFHPARLLALRHQLRVPGSDRLLRCLGRLATRKALRDAGLGAVEPAPFTLDTLRFRIQSSLFLPDGRQAGLEQARRLARLLAQRPDFFLSQQVSQQSLDLGIAVGAQLPLALRREHRREEGVGAAAECFDATGIGVHLAV